jgi:5-(carboxyamino)imidazole ribonucleotide mutase
MGQTVSIVMGSQSDLETVKEAVNVLKEFGIEYDAQVLSAHRTPRELEAYIVKAIQQGTKVFIAAAGGAAALAGVVASHTTLPVIGIPMETSSLSGLDSLLSTVQMPGGIPVASMAIGKAGAKNAGLFAVAILAVSDAELAKKLQQYKDAMREKIVKTKVDL